MSAEYIPQTHATTTGSTFVNFAITKDDRLRQLTFAVVLGQEARGLTARVYRKSTTAPDQLSCDIYDWNEQPGRWSFWKEDSQKYAAPPTPPTNAVRNSIDAFEVWTMTQPTAEEIERLHKLTFIIRAKA